MSVQRITTGITRTVYVTRRWAIKTPSCRYGWKYFLHGLLANLQEREWWGYDYRPEALCPVLAASRLGFWLVMPVATDIAENELPPREDFADLPCDYKHDNFGWYQGRIVLRDYGS